MKFWLNNAKTKYIDMTNIETLETLTGQNQKPEGKLYDRQQIQNTPFWLIGNIEQGYNIILGKWKLTQEPFKEKTPEDNYLAATMYLINNQWNIILSMILAITEDIKTIQQENNNKKTN